MPDNSSSTRRDLSRETLHAISTEFLANSTLKDAPLAEKKEYLKTKGLRDDEIEALLKRVYLSESQPKSGEEEGEAGNNKGKEKASQQEVEERSLVPAAGLKEVKPAPVQPAVVEHQQFQQPLIVTYPEFLAPPPAPPAPVNAKALVTGMYLAGGVASTVYGASKFLFQPMFDSLTAARSELAQTALTNLTEFNNKLSVLVPHRRFSLPTASHLHNGVTIGSERRPLSPSQHSTGTSPAHLGPGVRSLDHPGDTDRDASDSDDSDSDDENRSTASSLRTHLFHVDASTQTIPESSSSSSEDPSHTDPTLPSPSDKKLADITSHLATLIDSNSDQADSDLQFELQSLTAYLDSLHYEGSSLYGPAWPLVGGPGGQSADPIAKVKAEIRSVKGVFLNTKNFPAGR